MKIIVLMKVIRTKKTRRNMKRIVLLSHAQIREIDRFHPNLLGYLPEAFKPRILDPCESAWTLLWVQGGRGNSVFFFLISIDGRAKFGPR